MGKYKVDQTKKEPAERLYNWKIKPNTYKEVVSICGNNDLFYYELAQYAIDAFKRQANKDGIVEVHRTEATQADQRVLDALRLFALKFRDKEPSVIHWVAGILGLKAADLLDLLSTRISTKSRSTAA